MEAAFKSLLKNKTNMFRHNVRRGELVKKIFSDNKFSSFSNCPLILYIFAKKTDPVKFSELKK
jgi:hypothetical protein